MNQEAMSAVQAAFYETNAVLFDRDPVKELGAPSRITYLRARIVGNEPEGGALFVRISGDDREHRFDARTGEWLEGPRMLLGARIEDMGPYGPRPEMLAKRLDTSSLIAGARIR